MSLVREPMTRAAMKFWRRLGGCRSDDLSASGFQTISRFARAKLPVVSALASLRERADEIRTIAAAHGARNVRVLAR
jgi:hypothetical protein